MDPSFEGFLRRSVSSFTLRPTATLSGSIRSIAICMNPEGSKRLAPGTHGLIQMSNL
jgi:hypothetical protein